MLHIKQYIHESNLDKTGDILLELRRLAEASVNASNYIEATRVIEDFINDNRAEILKSMEISNIPLVDVIYPFYNRWIDDANKDEFPTNDDIPNDDLTIDDVYVDEISEF
tara:strand:- start:5358 stop:5687 length:330 start_codon:yes stop_codon:yes gene_type:complete